MNRHTVRTLLPVIAAACLLLGACDKSEDLNAIVAVTPWLQITNKGEQTLASSDVKIFAHYVSDTTAWHVVSYEEAGRGIITNKDTGEKLDPVLVGSVDMDGNLAFGPVSSEMLFLVACNRNPYGQQGEDVYDSKMFAYRGLQVLPGIEHLRLAIVFKPWQRGEWKLVEGEYVWQEGYLDLKWWMRNEDPTVYDNKPKKEEEAKR